MKQILITLLLILTVSAFGYEEQGEASWYGGKFQGRTTANGEIFDTNLFTAAHKTLPFNSIVKVTTSTLYSCCSHFIRIEVSNPPEYANITVSLIVFPNFRLIIPEILI